MARRIASVTLIALLTLVLTGCRLSTALVPVLPVDEGQISVSTAVRQPFYSPHDDLNRLTIRFYPEGFPGPQLPIDLARGASIEIRYAPESDRRFPERDFHAWPGEHAWLPELVAGHVYGQSFTSPYPYLSGVQVRVATFFGDLQPGPGTLRLGPAARVLDLPVSGRDIAHLPGGSEVSILGSAEGWAHVQLPDGRHGFIDLDDLAEFPAPARQNDADVVLELFDHDSGERLRTSVMNAADMFDNSHLTFEFEPIAEAMGQVFRFELSSPDATHGNAVTLRYSPTALYDDGFRFENGEVVPGDMIFRPVYDAGEPLWQGMLGDFEWAAPIDAFETSFAPLPETRDRYLAIVVHAGDAPINVPWSVIRPPGQQPLRVDGWPEAPPGGLVFNAVYRANVPLASIGRDVARDSRRVARTDPLFVTLMVLLTGSVALWTAHVARSRKSQDGD
jgi:hypothetical protein